MLSEDCWGAKLYRPYNDSSNAIWREEKMDFLPKYCTFPCLEWALVRKLGQLLQRISD